MTITQQIRAARAGSHPVTAGTSWARTVLLGRPEDPRWARPALWAIVIVAGVLYAWGMSAGGHANSYYSAAVRSGSVSWSAFFFGSLDAGNFITVDKPPMSLWAQALFARAFGFSSFSLLFPQVLFGIAAVLVLHSMVRRAFGHQAALIAAAVLTLTPITVAINRDNNPDTLLVLFLVLAAWAVQRSIETDRMRWLLVSAFFVGCGFNTKMLQAYVVVPALILAYLAAARARPVRRVGHLLAAGAALAVSSFWWMAIVDLIPAARRPFIGGSTDGTVWDLVVGYNGFGRVFGEDGGPGGGPGGGANFGGVPGAGRLFNDIMGGQISWLLPFAAISLVAGLFLLRKRPRVDLARAGLVIWGGWLVVHLAVFSFAEGTFHPYYATALAPAIAALTGAGAVLLYGAHKRSMAWAWVLPVIVAVTGVWAFVLLNRSPDWNPWLRWGVAAVTAFAVTALIAGRLLRGRGCPVAIAGLTAGFLAGLAGPGAYAVSAAASPVNGTNPLAGPSTGMGFGGPGRGGAPGGRPGMASEGAPFGMPDGRMPAGQRPDGNGRRAMRGGPAGPGGQVNAQMISYLKKHQGGARWLVAVGSAQQASSLILQTGEPVIAMGGFTGRDPAMTPAKLQQYVKDGKLRYVLINSGGGLRPDRGNSEVSRWVRQNGILVQPSEYGGASSSSESGSQLYWLR